MRSRGVPTLCPYGVVLLGAALCSLASCRPPDWPPHDFGKPCETAADCEDGELECVDFEGGDERLCAVTCEGTWCPRIPGTEARPYQ